MFFFEIILGFYFWILIIKNFGEFIDNIKKFFTIESLANPDDKALYFVHKLLSVKIKMHKFASVRGENKIKLSK